MTLTNESGNDDKIDSNFNRLILLVFSLYNGDAYLTKIINQKSIGTLN